MAHVPSAALVYQHNARPQPPMPPSGTPMFSLNPHQMNWQPDQESSPSSSSSASQPSSSYALMSGHHPASQLYPLPMLRYPPRSDAWRDGEESDPETGHPRLQAPDKAGTRRDARQVHPDAFTPSRDHSPVSMNAPFIPEGDSRHRVSSHHGYFRFAPYHVPTHSRGESSSTGSSDNRAPSPALSVASVQTSNSSHGPSSQLPIHPLLDVQPVPSYTRVKYTKQRLYNIDRKKICVYAEDNPNLRQEDIARKFNIERSTVSKILKNKHRWLSIDDEPPLLIAKQRQAKFPGIESRMEDWVIKSARKNIILTDAMLRKQALEFGRELGFPPANFKASPGWVENFKARVGIKQGFYHGNGKRAMVPQSVGALAIPPSFSMPPLPDPWGPDADMSLHPIERTAAALAAQQGLPYPHAVAHTDPSSPRHEEERSRDENAAGNIQQSTSISTATAADDSHWDQDRERSERRDGRDLEQDFDGGSPTEYNTHPQPFQNTDWESHRIPIPSADMSLVLPHSTTNAILASNIVDERTAGMPEVEQHVQALLDWMQGREDFADEYAHLTSIRAKVLLHVRTAPSTV